MKILWVVSAEPGSLYPVAPIALELVRRGHDVTALCEESARSTFERLGFEFRAASQLDAAMARFDPAAHGGGRAARLAWHEAYARGLSADVRDELASGAYDRALVDPLEPGASFGAEAAGVPAVSYVHWRMDETGPDVPFCFHLWTREQPADDAFVAWWNGLRALAGLGPDAREPSEARWYRSSPDLTLLLGLPELAHPKGDLPSYVTRVGPTPWSPASSDALPEWVEDVGSARPAVLASVSTIGAADRDLLAMLGDAVDGEDFDVVATIAASGELPPLPDNVRVASFVPHAALLPRVGAVLSHAGNGTATHAACAGVPMLLLPDGRDRFEVARGAVAAGVAIEIARDAVDADALRDALRRLLGDPGYRERAQVLAARASEYDAPRAAADAIEKLR